MEIMTLSEIMDKSIEILKKYMQTIVVFTLIYGIIIFISIFILIIIGGISIGLSAVFIKSPVLIGMIIALLTIVIMTISFTQYIGMIKISSQEYFKEKVLVDGALKVSFKNFFKTAGIVICAIILFIPGIAAFGGIGYVLFKALNAAFSVSNSIDINVILLMIAGAAVFIFAIFVVFGYITWFSFAFHAAVIEKKGVFASIKRSFSLVHSNFWKLFGTTLLITITLYAVRISINSFFALLGSVVFLILRLLNFQQDFLAAIGAAATYLQFPLSIVYWLIVSPLGYIMLTFLYFNQRFKKEGFDLILKLKEIQKNDEINSSIPNRI
ncbi:hypothetical protein M2651_04580 [Clostridium sp. SYSU_GA19001]|uniref:hypothetical protein n=1 Tax=Clostridium caldaquaticum TaxID=2940653 RepID=UPI0020773F3A|nr:hypothetical protein [Clostridium caldaquaticum]MCM8710301.1 hypothetical protein [Clostridium caldaquaticum]